MTPPRPVIQTPTIRIFRGDALRVADRLDLPANTAVVADPPWGVSNNCRYDRFTKNGRPTGTRWKTRKIRGDSAPFDPSPWIGFCQVVLWGANHFADRLPPGTWLVWLKKPPHRFGSFQSDAEVAWRKGGRGVYCFDHTWNGFQRASERKSKLHPNQKPVALFRWILDHLKPTDLVLDPYCGSAPVAVACQDRGIPYVGIENDPQWIAAARTRLTEQIPPRTLRTAA